MHGAIPRSLLPGPGIFLVLLAPVGEAAPEALPTLDPPAKIEALARLTGDDRKAKLNRTLQLSYQTAGPAWKLVHACVTKDTGKIQALKVAYSKEVRRTRTEEKWKQYELLIQAFFLHHAGEFRDYLRDDLLQVAMIREQAVYSKLSDGVERFDAASTTELLSGACAAALFPKETLPYTHACVHKSLDRFHLLALDPADEGESRVVSINAILQCALVTGRLGEFKNGSWRRVFDDLRDLLPPNGMPPRSKAATDEVFGDWGAALRIGAVLFNEPTYAYAANKFRAAMMADPAHAAGSLSPVQWSFLNYAVLDKMALAPPPTLSVVQRTYGPNDDTIRQVILRTGHHPRAAFFRLEPSPPSPGATTAISSSPLEFWAGGSLLTPRGSSSLAPGNHFAVATPGAVFPPPRETTPSSPVLADPSMRCDPKLTTVAHKGDDAQATLVFANYLAEGATLTRRFILTREGILVIADRLEGGANAKGQSAGPLWNVGPAPAAKGENWFAFTAFDHHLPPGYDGTPRDALVWFAPSPGGSIGLAGEAAYHKITTTELRHDFLTVVVPIAAGVDPGPAAALITSDGPSSVTVADVTITLTGQSWSVTGQEPRGHGPAAARTWRPAQQLGPRVWTDRTGRQIDGELLSATDDAIEVRLASKKIVTIPLARLSEADRAYLRTLQPM